MADDQPAELRLCQCGKHAGHDSICRPQRAPAGLEPDDVERVPLQFEEDRARQREERHAKRSRQFAAERREHRTLSSTLALHREAIERAATLSTVKAGSSEPSRGGGGDHAGPARQQQLDDDPRWREHWTVIRSRLERVHELLDELQGFGPVASTTTMLGVEKDKRILAEVGLSPIAVVEKLGRDIAGSPETVRRVRRSADRKGSDGTRIEPRVDSGSVDS